ncbi:hypothetical protein D3C84_841160 [compost metagenome]
MLEGMMIGLAGIVTGWLIGSTGSVVFIRTLLNDTGPTEQAPVFHYPFALIVPLVLFLIVAAVLMNIGPARGALRIAPAEALRSADQ